MRVLKNLNDVKSINSKKLVFEESWLDKIDLYTNYLIYLAMAIFSLMSIFEIDPNSKNDTVGYYIFPFIILISAYAFYCKFSEKCLKEITFNIHSEDAKMRILQFGKNNNFRITKISNNLIFLNKPTNDFDFGNHEKTTLVFIKDYSILFTIIQEGVRLNFPVLFSQYFFKSKMKRILKN
ncbi:hypothetical protein [Halpernia frigidisoli]|uniref:Uncharacterized protein n=1 Tax=Halpernia frigidisoli TaxID=1125876 RepID=A0A1I3FM37_9FLAO|nr:hypothetical protein [Halpernia frigidisoli]SFI11991.1 hypothetical protein SAMN05443292_1455 [Halpernia frigidisoli]